MPWRFFDGVEGQFCIDALVNPLERRRQLEISIPIRGASSLPRPGHGSGRTSVCASDWTSADASSTTSLAIAEVRMVYLNSFAGGSDARRGINTWALP